LPVFIAAILSEGGQEYRLSPCFPNSACRTGATRSSFLIAQEQFRCWVWSFLSLFPPGNSLAAPRTSFSLVLVRSCPCLRRGSVRHQPGTLPYSPEPGDLLDRPVPQVLKILFLLFSQTSHVCRGSRLPSHLSRSYCSCCSVAAFRLLFLLSTAWEPSQPCAFCCTRPPSPARLAGHKDSTTCPRVRNESSSHTKSPLEPPWRASLRTVGVSSNVPSPLQRLRTYTTRCVKRRRNS
jgi:hypothetical protein